MTSKANRGVIFHEDDGRSDSVNIHFAKLIASREWILALLSLFVLKILCLQDRFANILARQKYLLVAIIAFGSITGALAKTENESSFFDSTVQELLQEKIKDERIHVEAEYNSQSKISKIRSKQDKIKSIILDKFDPKTSSFSVNIVYIDNTSELLSGQFTFYVQVPVAARNIKYAEIVQSIDIATLKIKIDTLDTTDILSTSEVIGMQAKNYIPKGAVVKRIDIANPPVIKNNDPVNIIYSSGSINLKTVGTAMGVGAVGDMIKVKNGASGAVLLGQIVNKNTVQVNGGDNE